MLTLDGYAVHQIDLGPCTYRFVCDENGPFYERLDRMITAYPADRDRVLVDREQNADLIDRTITGELYSRGEYQLEPGEGFECPECGWRGFFAGIDFGGDEIKSICDECGETF